MKTLKRFVFLAMALLVGLQSASAQTDTFSVSTEEVRIDVLVTDNGWPVNNLTASDFEVYDNGVEQEIEYAKLHLFMPVHVTLVFDTSRSVAGELFGHLKNAAHELLSDLGGEDRVALILFNHAVSLGSSLTNDFDRIKSALDRTQPDGNSSLIDASYAGLILAESGPELPLVLIFSDGLDTVSWLTGETVLTTAKRNDSVVYAISTRRRPENSFLNDLTSLTGGNLFEVESTEDLASAFLDAIREFRYRYLLSYTPRDVSPEGWHDLKVRVKDRSVTIRTRPGYMRGRVGGRP